MSASDTRRQTNKALTAAHGTRIGTVMGKTTILVISDLSDLIQLNFQLQWAWSNQDFLLRSTISLRNHDSLDAHQANRVLFSFSPFFHSDYEDILATSNLSLVTLTATDVSLWHCAWLRNLISSTHAHTHTYTSGCLIKMKVFLFHFFLSRRDWLRLQLSWRLRNENK